MIDLRSDTITQPTEAMLAAIAHRGRAMLPLMALLPAFVVVKLPMLPVPLAPKPIAVLLLVQL
mgnify:CR=1 FL=1